MKIWPYLLVICLSFSSSAANDCLKKRKSFIEEFRSLKSSFVEDNYEVDDVIASDSWQSLCDEDRIYLRKIFFSTFRVFLVQDGDVLKSTEQTGTLLENKKLLLALPTPRGSDDDYKANDDVWRKAIDSKKPFMIRIENTRGKDANITVNSVKEFENGSRMSEFAALFLLDKNPVQVNPEFLPFKKDILSIGLPLNKITMNFPLATYKKGEYGYYKESIDVVVEIKRNFFSTGYDNGKIRAGFGMSSFGSYSRCQNCGDNFFYNIFPVSEETFGGGLYDENFNLVGLHYFNIKLDDGKIGNVFNPIPVIEGLQ